MPGHSTVLAPARSAAEATSPKAAAGASREAAPATPRRLSEPLSRMNSLPDLDSDSCSDSSDSSDEGPPATRSHGGRGPAGIQADGTAAAAGGVRSGVKHNGRERLTLRQPLLWMGCTCHWQKYEATPKLQQVELADCSTSTIAAAADQDTSPLPPVPPELSRLMPSGLPAAPAAVTRAGLPPEAEAPLQRLQAELAYSQASYQTILRALHRKTQECESLTGVVQELTAGRAKAAVGRSLLQQRCMALLDDVSRLGRVANLARRGQADSRAAAEAAATARLEAEGEVAEARREVATLERENLELAATNRHLARRMRELERRCQNAAGAES